MFLKSIIIGVVCFLAVLVSVESLECYSCTTTSTIATDPCFSGNGTTLSTNVCPNTYTHCTKRTTVAGAVTTTYRGCTIGCTNSTTTECCTTDLCNIITQAPVSGFQCYGCTTASNSTADDCFVGNVSSPIMISYTCPAGSNDCFMESTMSTLTRGCRIGSCDTNECKSCNTNLCNTMKGDASSGSGFSFAGFILLITVSLWKSTKNFV